MCITFAACWTPYAVVPFFYMFHPSHEVPQFLTVAAPFFAKSSTCCNPVIYFLVVKCFRKELLEIFEQRFCKRQSSNTSDPTKSCIELQEIKPLVHDTDTTDILKTIVSKNAVNVHKDLEQCKNADSELQKNGSSNHSTRNDVTYVLEEIRFIDDDRSDEVYTDALSACNMDDLCDVSTQTDPLL